MERIGVGISVKNRFLVYSFQFTENKDGFDGRGLVFHYFIE